MYDLHRHFSGSISISTIAKLAGINIDEAKNIMTYKDEDDRNYEAFFKKFNVLNKIEWTHKKIELAIQDVVWGIKRENIKYAEIKFSIQKYLSLFENNIDDAISWFAYTFDKHASEWDIDFDLILSLTYESNRDLQLKIANSINSNAVHECIAGIDLVGNENFFDTEFYKPIMANWRAAGKICIAHAGEIDKLENVKAAIHDLKVHRVCHGLACTNDVDLMKMANDNNVVFDVGLTSNHFTGVADINNHPIKFMLDNDCNVTIGTDDPVVFNTTLSDEYNILVNKIGINKSQLARIVHNSVNFSAKNLIKNK